MLVGAPAKILANKQIKLKQKRKSVEHATFHATMTRIDYTPFNSFQVDINPSPTGISYSVGLTNTIIGRVNLALCDGGANGYIKGNDMRLVSYNNNVRYVTIDIVGDRQLIGARLCTKASVTKLNDR